MTGSPQYDIATSERFAGAYVCLPTIDKPGHRSVARQHDTLLYSTPLLHQHLLYEIATIKFATYQNFTKYVFRSLSLEEWLASIRLFLLLPLREMTLKQGKTECQML